MKNNFCCTFWKFYAIIKLLVAISKVKFETWFLPNTIYWKALYKQCILLLNILSLGENLRLSRFDTLETSSLLYYFQILYNVFVRMHQKKGQVLKFSFSSTTQLVELTLENFCCQYALTQSSYNLLCSSRIKTKKDLLPEYQNSVCSPFQ